MGKPEFLHASPRSNRGTLRLAETFVSRQGEGKLTGTESYFVRTSGCNLRCWFCDTPYASWRPEGATSAIETVLQEVVTSDVSHVVITGGEPLIAAGVPSLCEQLRQVGRHVTVETAGTVDTKLYCDLMSISPKLRSSTPDRKQHPRWSELHEARRMPVEIMGRLAERASECQFKFVVDSPDDFEEIESIVDSVSAACEDVWIMPQAVTVEALDRANDWLRPWVESHGYRFCDRMQIRWYGNRRGT